MIKRITELRDYKSYFIKVKPKNQINNISASKPLNLNLSPFSQIHKSTINFGAMKKSQFSGIDLIMINQYKAPIEKMNSNKDFQNYCQEILDIKYLGEENIKNLSKSKDLQAQIQKEAILKEWTDYIAKENDAYTPAIELFILSSITKNLELESNYLPPVLDKRKVADTIEEITEKSKQNRQYQCNFDKLYRINLQKECLEEETQLDENLSGWVLIPSKEHDPQNFKENVKKLKALSHHNWCTKTYNAEPYLAQGDFHVYLEKGKAKLGVRFDSNEIQEIQGEINNSTIPLSYLDIAKEHVENGKYKLSYNTQYEFQKAEEAKEKIAEIKNDLKEPIQQKNYQKVLEYFSVKVEKDKNGLMTLSYISEPDSSLSITFNDIDVDINDLLKQVKKVNGNVDLKNDTHLKSTGALEEVGRMFRIDGCFNLNEFPNLSKFQNIYGLTKTQKEILSKPIIAKIKVDLDTPIKNKDYQRVLEYFGVQVEKDENRLMTLSELNEPNSELDIFFQDIDVNINDLLKQVKKVNGDVNLSKDKALKSTGALEEAKTIRIWDCFNLKEFPKLKKWTGISGIRPEQKKIIYKSIADKIKTDLAKPIEKKDYQTILKYFGVKILEVDENGLMRISELKEPNSEQYICFNDAGIDINDLLKHIKKVDGDLNLENDSYITSTGALEEVGGNATFQNCKNLKEILKLKKVHSTVDIKDCTSLNSTGALEKCEFLSISSRDTGGADLVNLKDFPNLKNIQGVSTINSEQLKLINKRFIDKIKSDLQESIKKKDYQTILEYLGITVTKDSNGFMTVSELCHPRARLGIKFSDIDIDINDLLKQIKKVEHAFNLGGDKKLISTGALEEIGWFANFEGCTNLEAVPNLKKSGHICANDRRKEKFIEEQIKQNNTK